MADTVRTLRVELTGGSAGFERTIRGAANEVSGLGKGLDRLGGAFAGLSFGALSGQVTAVAGAFGAVGGVLVMATKSALEYAGAIGDIADRSGHTVEWLQATKFAAEQSGTSLEAVTIASRKLQNNLVEGSADTTQAVRDLGLSFQDLRNQSPDEMMNRVLEAVSKIENPTQRTALATQLLGKSGQDLVPLAENFAAARARAEELGIVLSEKDVRAAQQLGDGLDGLRSTFDGLINNLGVTVTSSAAVHEGVRLLTEGVAGLSRFVAENRDQIRSFVVDGLQLLVQGFQSGLVGIGLFSEGMFQLQRVLIEMESKLLAVQLGADLLARVLKNPLDAQAAFADYEAALGRLNAATAEAVRKQQEQRDAIGGALVAGGVAAGTLSAALQRLGNSEVELNGKTRRTTDDLADQGKEAERLGKEHLKVLIKGMEDYGKELEQTRAAQEALAGILGPSTQDATIEMGRLADATERFGGVTQLSDQQLVQLVSRLQQAAAQGGDNAWGFETLAAAMEEAATRSRAVQEGVGIIARETDALAVSSARSGERIVEAQRREAASFDHLIDQLGGFGDAIEELGPLWDAMGVDATSALRSITEELANGVQNMAAFSAALASGNAAAAAQSGLAIGTSAFGAGQESDSLGGAALRGLLSGSLLGGVAGHLFGGGSSAAEEATLAIEEQFGSLENAADAARQYGLNLDDAFASRDPQRLTDALEQVNAAIAKAQRAQANLEQGLSTARGGAEGLQGLLNEGQITDPSGALARAIGRVAEELLAHGLGVMDARLQESQAFGAAGQAAGFLQQLIAGMQQAGLVDQNVLADTTQATQDLIAQSQQAALDAGLSQEDATRAGFSNNAQLLQAQLNAALASGQQIPADLQALLDQAEANNIDIVADPMLQALDQSRQQTALQQKMLAALSGSSAQPPPTPAPADVPGFASGTMGRFVNFGEESIVALHGWEAVVPQGESIGGTTIQSTTQLSFEFNPMQTQETREQFQAQVLEWADEAVQRNLAEAVAQKNA